MEKIDWTKLENMDHSEDKNCGGPNACEGRKFDDTKNDCQQCLKESGAEDDDDDSHPKK